MLELFHHGSSVCAAKVRLSLEEKGIEWNGRYIDILKGDQFTSAYRQLNPKAVVPTLVHDEFVVTESSVICEYLEDVFPEVSLRPDSPREHVHQLYWSKRVDETLHPACAELTFASSHRHTVLKLGERGVREFLDATPPQSVTSTWFKRKKEIVREGFEAPGVADTVRLYVSHLDLMEADLSNRAWLAGDTYSLADTAMLPYVMRLEMLQMSAIWTGGRLPRVEEWLAVCKERPAFDASIWTWMPDDLVNDLSTFGTRSWPTVAEILEIQ